MMHPQYFNDVTIYPVGNNKRRSHDYKLSCAGNAAVATGFRKQNMLLVDFVDDGSNCLFCCLRIV